jgi:putative transposase
MPQPHRKTIKHIDEPGHVHELTFSCYCRLPLLTDEISRALLARSVQRAMDRHGYGLLAFVFMPEHVHLMALPERRASTLSALLNAIKRPYTHRIKRLLVESRSKLLPMLTVRQRPGIISFRYRQEGPGYDRNITERKTMEAAIDYIHNNPVRRGLCERAVDWRWSSARRRILPESPLDPDVPVLRQLPPEFAVQQR